MLLVDSNLKLYESCVGAMPPEQKDVFRQLREAEADKSEAVHLLVDLVDVPTGKTWMQMPYSTTKLKSESWDEFYYGVECYWEDGNYGCDCNRGSLTRDHCPRPLPEWCDGQDDGDWFCGEDVKARIWHDGEVIFSDWPESDA